MSRKSKPSTIPAGALLFLSLALPTFPGSGNTVRGLLRNRIITAGFPVKIAVGEEHILASSLVPLFYKQRNFEPAWSRGRVLMPEVDSLLSSIGKARLEGLDPEDYRLARLSSVVHEIELGETKGNLIDSLVFADSDILLTDAFFMYATHLSPRKSRRRVRIGPVGMVCAR